MGKAERCVNTVRPLTHSLDCTEEGLAMQATRTCSIPDCQGPIGAGTGAGRGWCAKHYSRWRVHGDPLFVLTPRMRFDRKVDTGTTPDGCHTWLGATHRDGYGQFWNGRRVVLAHRWQLEQALGRPLTPEELACHRCDNPPCVRAEHLFVGSQADNVNDAIRKGRHRNVR